MLQWIDGEPLVTSLPTASVENGCIQENMAIVTAIAAYLGALRSGNAEAIVIAYSSAMLAYSALLDCLGL
jgi:hypothetical protein